MKRAKLGRAFERVVSDIIRSLDPNCDVKTGEWINGPDGFREIDVHVQGEADGVFRRIIIECKDFNPKTTGPVGIKYIDELESKRRDLGMDISFLCSNSGFTENAIRKARRVGIGLIGVFKKDDSRIRFNLFDEIYVRHVRVQKLQAHIKWNRKTKIEEIPFDQILHNGIPVWNWITRRAVIFLCKNPVVKGEFSINHKFSSPLEITLPTETVEARELGFTLQVTGRWSYQQIAMDATRGLYDWLRRRVRLASGPSQFVLKDVDFRNGKTIRCPPRIRIYF